MPLQPALTDLLETKRSAKSAPVLSPYAERRDKRVWQVVSLDFLSHWLSSFPGCVAHCSDCAQCTPREIARKLLLSSGSKCQSEAHMSGRSWRAEQETR
jgi:hypothetical protein